VNSAGISSAKTAFTMIADAAARRVPEKAQNGSAVAEAVLGAYGQFLTSLLERDDYRAAVILYRTTESYPEAAVQVFPLKAYPTEYREILVRSYKELQRTIRAHSEMETVNRAKLIKRYPTFIVRNLIYLPLSYVAAMLMGFAPLKPDSKSFRRGAGYNYKVNAIYEAKVAAFDKMAFSNGWKISRSEIQKQEMLLDQVKRLTTIFNNHSRTAAQESKSRRRQLEANPEANLT
jgi:hypothetical protein